MVAMGTPSGGPLSGPFDNPFAMSGGGQQPLPVTPVPALAPGLTAAMDAQLKAQQMAQAGLPAPAPQQAQVMPNPEPVGMPPADVLGPDFWGAVLQKIMQSRQSIGLPPPVAARAQGFNGLEPLGMGALPPPSMPSPQNWQAPIGLAQQQGSGFAPAQGNIHAQNAANSQIGMSSGGGGSQSKNQNIGSVLPGY